MTITDWLGIAWIITLLGVDVWLRGRFGEDGTFSGRIAMWSRRYPLIPFIAGLFAGHLWFPV